MTPLIQSALRELGIPEHADGLFRANEVRAIVQYAVVQTTEDYARGTALGEQTARRVLDAQGGAK